MKIEIEKRNDIPSGMEEYVRKRAKKLAKYLKEESLVRFVISHQKGNFFTEITSNDIGNIFHSKAFSPDLKLSIEGAIKKIEHQLKKFKERVVDHKKV
ncbi:MAG: ribosome-associated translation inhibitor RaiA, partial [bacterium]